MDFSIKKSSHIIYERLKNLFCKVRTFLTIGNRQRYIYFSYCCLLVGLLFIRDVVDVPLNKYIFLGLFAVASIITTSEVFTYVIAFTMPFRTGLPDLYIVLIAICFYILKNLKLHSIKQWILISSVPLFIFILELILSATNLGIDFLVAIRIFAYLYVIALLFYDYKHVSKHIVLTFVIGLTIAYTIIALGSLIVGLWGTINKNREWLIPKNIFKNFRLSSRQELAAWFKQVTGLVIPVRNTGLCLGDNPNNIGMFCLIAICSCYAIYPLLDKDEKKVALTCSFLCLLFGFLTKSRSFLIFMAAAGILMLIISGATKRREVIDVVIVFVLTILIISVVMLINGELINSLINRFFEKSTESGGGRITWIVEYTTKMFSNIQYILIGTGVTNLQAVYGLEQPPHTNFVQIMCSYGIIVFVAFVAVIIYFLIKTKKFYKLNNYKCAFYLPTLMMFLFTFTGQILNPPGILIGFIPCFALLGFADKKSSIVIPEKYERYENILLGGRLCIASTEKLSFTKKMMKEYSEVKVINASKTITKTNKEKIINQINENQPSVVVFQYTSFRKIWKSYNFYKRNSKARMVLICEKKSKRMSFKERFLYFIFLAGNELVYCTNKDVLVRLKGKSFLKRYPEFVISQKFKIEKVVELALPRLISTNTKDKDK